METAEQSSGRKSSRVVHRFKSSSWTSRFLLATGVLVFVLSGCRAYQLGAPTLYRQDVRTIHIPIAESESFRKYLGQRITESVAKEVEDETPFRLAGPGVADSFLQVRIFRDKKQVLGENTFDEARDIAVGLLVEATWTDRMGTPLMQRQILRIDRDVNFVPEGGQSMTMAQQELIDRIARQIVDQMEIPW